MNKKRRIMVSKLVSLVLRHKPGRIGIKLDAAGWVNVSQLLDAFNKKSRFRLDEAGLIEMVDSGDKIRYQFSDDGISSPLFSVT